MTDLNTVVATWFPHRKPIAMGIVATGASICKQSFLTQRRITANTFNSWFSLPVHGQVLNSTTWFQSSSHGIFFGHWRHITPCLLDSPQEEPEPHLPYTRTMECAQGLD